MLYSKPNRMKQTIFSILAFALLFVVFSCANIGRPDGGPYDELPPKFVKSSPAPSALNNSKKKISIEFDEFIKLENGRLPAVYRFRFRQRRESGRRSGRRRCFPPLQTVFPGCLVQSSRRNR